MATILRRPLRGQDIYSLTARGQTADSAGLLSNSGSLQNFHAIVDAVSYRGRSITDMIQPVTALVENHVIVEKDDQVVIREILRRGTDSQLLPLTFYLAATDFIVVTLARGYPATIGAGQSVATVTFYGTMMSLGEVWRKGKTTAELVIGQIDRTDANNPLYAMAATS